MMIVGHNLKKIREQKGLSLRDISKKINVTPSFLSQIETGKTTPSLSTLKRIADSLEVTIAHLMGENIKVTENPIVRNNDRTELMNVSDGLRIQLLTSPGPNKQMEPLYFTLEPGSQSGSDLYQHFGQEFILVIKGTLEIILNSTKYLLNKGDSMYFNSSIPHSFNNSNIGRTEVVWVVTPPSF